MNDKSYMNGEVMESFWVARSLATTAIQELGRTPDRAGAIDAMRRGLGRIEAAGRALEAGDPTQALRDLVEAERAATEAKALANRHPTAPAPDVPDFSSDLLDQTCSAVDRVAHRVRNASSRHTSFGAIATPPSERRP